MLQYYFWNNFQKYADLEYALERTKKTDIKQTLLLFAYDFEGVKSKTMSLCLPESSY